MTTNPFFVPMAMCLCIAISGCAPAPLSAPDGFTAYRSTDQKQTFLCGCPNDWTVDGGGKTNAWAKFTNGTAMIEIRTDLSGSLMGDVARMGRDPDDPTTDPVAVIHEGSLVDAQEKFTEYDEQPVQELDSKLGPGRVSEFTAKTAFGKALHGYRATIMSRDRRIVTYCTCDETDWNTLAESYMHMLRSFNRQG